jgi:hypothetical protein
MGKAFPSMRQFRAVGRIHCWLISDKLSLRAVRGLLGVVEFLPRLPLQRFGLQRFGRDGWATYSHRNQVGNLGGGKGGTMGSEDRI